MNYNSKIMYDFNTVAKFARDNARKEQPKASRIGDFLTYNSIRNYVNLCYTYLRWVDDFVDNPETPIDNKKRFIEYQKDLISTLYKTNNITSPIIEEVCLVYFAEYAKSSNNLILLDEVKNMVDALSMDVSRLESSGIFSKAEFECYINKMAKSLFNILFIFLYPKEKFHGIDFFLGRFTANAQMIRDLSEDFEAGFINITREDIIHYNINSTNIANDKNLSLWLADRTKIVLKILYEEVALLKYLPLMFRIFTWFSLIYYMTWIIRAKVYGYTLKYINEQTFLKELKTYFLSLLISINIFFKGFILSKK